MKMKRSFSLINGLKSGPWHEVVKEALKPLGTVDVMGEGEAVNRTIEGNYAAAIVDASVVVEPRLLISRLLAQRPDVRVVVAESAPTWDFAKGVLQAGAVDCIEKSNEVAELRSVFEDILSRQAPAPLPSATPDESDGLSGPLLLADNHIDYLATWKKHLEKAGYIVLPAASPVEARRILENGKVMLAIIDERLVNDEDERDISGLELAQHVAPSIPKIILTKYPDFDSVRKVMKPGESGARSAIDVVDKNNKATEILAAVRRAFEIAQEQAELRFDETEQLSARDQRRKWIGVILLLLAFAFGVVAVASEEPKWLLATLTLVISVVVFVGLAMNKPSR